MNIIDIIFLLINCLSIINSSLLESPYLNSIHCPEGWTWIEDGCFKVILKTSNTQTWHDFETICQSHHGHLASIHSSAQNDHVWDLIFEAGISPTNYVFIGLGCV